MKCGVCGQHYGELLVKHGEVCEDDRMAGRITSSPEVDDYASQLQNNIPERTINDIKREEEESNA